MSLKALACSHSVRVSDKGGNALFHQEAHAFNAMPRVRRADALKAVEAIPIAAKRIVTYDPDKEDLFICTETLGPLVTTSLRVFRL